jgi:hypothetical protein
MTVVAAIAVPLVLPYQGWSYWVFRQRLTHPPDRAGAMAPQRAPGPAAAPQERRWGRVTRVGHASSASPASNAGRRRPPAAQVRRLAAPARPWLAGWWIVTGCGAAVALLGLVTTNRWARATAERTSARLMPTSPSMAAAP